jgi:hypothetical protein
MGPRLLLFTEPIEPLPSLASTHVPFKGSATLRSLPAWTAQPHGSTAWLLTHMPGWVLWSLCLKSSTLDLEPQSCEQTPC